MNVRASVFLGQQLCHSRRVVSQQKSVETATARMIVLTMVGAVCGVERKLYGVGSIFVGSRPVVCSGCGRWRNGGVLLVRFCGVF